VTRHHIPVRISRAARLQVLFGENKDKIGLKIAQSARKKLLFLF